LRGASIVRDDTWTLVRFLHLLAAATWVGGMIALGAVAGPAARRSGDRVATRRVVASVWRRFGAISAFAAVVLIATGVGLVHHRGMTLESLGGSDYGRRVLTKIGLLAAMGGITLMHLLWQGPPGRRARALGDRAAARRWHRVGVVGDSLLLLAALAALWLAVSLVR